MRVGILGGGRWGQALARLVLAAGNKPLIAYRDRKDKPPHILESTKDAPEVSATCDLILVATSASELRSAIQLAEPGPGNRVVVAGRGPEPDTGKWLTEVVGEACDAVRVGTLAGPAPVDEILNGGLCAGVIASHYSEVRAQVVEALHSTRYRVYESEDLQGVQLAASAVPVLAALIGMATTLGGAGVGMHAMVVARGIGEAARLAGALKGDPATLAGLAGVGDLVAAQGKAGHRSFDIGAALAQGKKPRTRASIERRARNLLELAHQHQVDLPLTKGLVAIFDGMDPLDAVSALMQRSAAFEIR